MINSSNFIKHGDQVDSETFQKPVDGVLQYLDDVGTLLDNVLDCDFKTGKYHAFGTPVGRNIKQYIDIFEHYRNSQVIGTVPHLGEVTYPEHTPVFAYDGDARIGVMIGDDEVKIVLTDWDWFNVVTGEFKIKITEADSVNVLLFDGTPSRTNMSGDFEIVVKYWNKSSSDVYIDGAKVATLGIDFSSIEELVLVDGECIIEHFAYTPFFELG